MPFEGAAECGTSSAHHAALAIRCARWPALIRSFVDKCAVVPITESIREQVRKLKEEDERKLVLKLMLVAEGAEEGSPPQSARDPRVLAWGQVPVLGVTADGGDEDADDEGGETVRVTLRRPDGQFAVAMADVSVNSWALDQL